MAYSLREERLVEDECIFFPSRPYHGASNLLAHIHVYFSIKHAETDVCHQLSNKILIKTDNKERLLYQHVVPLFLSELIFHTVAIKTECLEHEK